jgi:hypothetical protein
VSHSDGPLFLHKRKKATAFRLKSCCFFYLLIMNGALIIEVKTCCKMNAHAAIPINESCSPFATAAYQACFPDQTFQSIAKIAGIPYINTLFVDIHKI